MNRNIKQTTIFASSLAMMLMAPMTVQAATISVSPGSASLTNNQSFTVNVRVDGQNENFNAAQANVALSTNLTVTDLILGDCGFSFAKTPEVANPSFVGVILGGSSRDCTVYSLTITPKGETNDNATITLTNGSVRRAGNAAELLTGIGNGNYTFGGGNVGSGVTNIFSTQTQITPVTGTANTIELEEDLSAYTVAIKVVDSNDQPIENAVVKITPQLATGGTVQEVKTNKEGIAEFKNVPQDMYTVAAEYDNKVLAEQIINAKGKDSVLTLGLKEEKKPVNYTPAILGFLGIIVALLIIFRARVATVVRNIRTRFQK